MRATLKLAQRATYADYLAAETLSPTRHEFFDGVIVSMSGGSDEHTAIATRFAYLCTARLSGRCRYYSVDQRFWMAGVRRARYSDGSIICGPPEHPAHDRQATTNPVVVVEVLSPSTEGDDEGEKRRDFATLALMEGYVLAAQDERCVRVYRRDAAGGWRELPDVYRDGDRFELPRLASAISVGELYDGVIDADGRSLLGEG